MNRIRFYTPYAVAIVCIFVGAVEVFAKIQASAQVNTPVDMVTSWEEHVEPLRQALPREVYAAGYMDSSDIPGSPEPFDNAELGLTQYTLAPVTLQHGIEGAWIVGNFGSSVRFKKIQPWLAGTLGQFTIQDFGFGLYLIHRGG